MQKKGELRDHQQEQYQRSGHAWRSDTKPGGKPRLVNQLTEYPQADEADRRVQHHGLGDVMQLGMPQLVGQDGPDFQRTKRLANPIEKPDALGGAQSRTESIAGRRAPV